MGPKSDVLPEPHSKWIPRDQFQQRKKVLTALWLQKCCLEVVIAFLNCREFFTTFLEVEVFQKGLFRASPLQLMTYRRLSVTCIGFHRGRDLREMESPITTRLLKQSLWKNLLLALYLLVFIQHNIKVKNLIGQKQAIFGVLLLICLQYFIYLYHQNVNILKTTFSNLKNLGDAV